MDQKKNTIVPANPVNALFSKNQAYTLLDETSILASCQKPAELRPLDAMYKNYPDLDGIRKACDRLGSFSHLLHEYGATDIETQLKEAQAFLEDKILTLQRLPVDPSQARNEPDSLEEIRLLRPSGPRKLATGISDTDYCERLTGALLGRFAGCTLGAPVELWEIERMENLARENGEPFPPQNYWTRVPDPYRKRYKVSPNQAYTRDHINGVPVDDDVTYTILGLLIMEAFGPGFSVQETGRVWLKLLPYACTAEEIALQNLRKGTSADIVGQTDNPFCEWIGADIRADPWGYLAPGWPEKAAQFAYRDASLTHRRNGIYSSMFFAASISAAFTLADPMDALQIGLTEIPEDCGFAKAIQWAFQVAPEIKNYKQARAAVDAKFDGMHPVHSINNACLTVFGISIGGTDFTRVISETVAMGLDNDCTAATAGSIVGAVVGRSGIPEHWIKPFGNTIHTYLIGHECLSLDDILARFQVQMKQVSTS